MSIGAASPDETAHSVDVAGQSGADTVESMEQGGDAACWLGRVCDSCGALIEGSRGVPCWRCNTPWQPA